MRIAAFDPGRTTSYAILDTEAPHRIRLGELELIGSGRLARPCPLHLRDITDGVDAAVVEEVGARPMQGVSATFTFGLAIGSLLGGLGALQMPVTLVSPSEWKRASRLGNLSRDAAKDAARSYARELWPCQERLLRVKKNHGLAEAALMARWYFLEGPGRDVKADRALPALAAIRAA